jgi:hypothetical protein
MEMVGEDPTVLGETVVGEDLTTLDEAAVAEAWRWTRRSGHVRCGPGGDRRGVGGGPDDGRRGDNDAGVEAIEEQAYGWQGNDSSQG